VSSTAERIAQSIILVDKPAKGRLLVETLRESAVGQTLVFTRTKHGADKVVKQLHHAGMSAEAIHGNKSQNQRERVLGAFRSGSLKTLVATDIAARGIDVDGISLVINFDLPNIPESYVHRIGRTARAGAEGVAISFCDHEERAFLRDIERLIGMKLPSTDKRANPQQADEAAAHHRPQQNRNSRNGNRNGQQQRRGGGRGHNGQQRHANGNASGQNGQPRQANANGQNGQSHQANGNNHNGQQRQANAHNGNQNGHNGQQRRNGKPHRNGKPNHNGRQQHGGGQNRHAPATPSAPDNIGTVGFMRQPSRQSQAGDGQRNSR
jgi:ATP-dependent RNA helicase RhlE